MKSGTPDYGWMSTKRETVTPVDNKTFDNVLSTYTSDSFDVREFLFLCIYINLDVTLSPTRIDINIEFSDDEITFYQLVTGPFANIRYAAASGDRLEAVEAPLRANYIRFKITATGTDATNTFALTLKAFMS